MIRRTVEIWPAIPKVRRLACCPPESNVFHKAQRGVVMIFEHPVTSPRCGFGQLHTYQGRCPWLDYVRTFGALEAVLPRLVLWRQSSHARCFGGGSLTLGALEAVFPRLCFESDLVSSSPHLLGFPSNKTGICPQTKRERGEFPYDKINLRSPVLLFGEANLSVSRSRRTTQLTLSREATAAPVRFRLPCR